MASSRFLTLYKIRHRAGGGPITHFEDALNQDVLGRPTLSTYELITPVSGTFRASTGSLGGTCSGTSRAAPAPPSPAASLPPLPRIRG